MNNKGITKINRALELISEACKYTENDLEYDSLNRIYNKLENVISE